MEPEIPADTSGAQAYQKRGKKDQRSSRHNKRDILCKQAGLDPLGVLFWRLFLV